MSKELITIITPVYNRKSIIPNLLESLKKQTLKNFKWLIIDDGSTDGLDKYIQSIHENCDGINIQYVCKENGGKHTALNFSHQYIDSELICIVDSDDTLTHDAIETITHFWEQYKSTERLAGLVFKRQYYNGKNISQGFPADIWLASHYDRLNKGINADCCEVIKASLFKQYPFPFFEKERFLGEGYLWNCIAKAGYKELFINKAIYNCDYLEGGLSKSGKKLRISNPLGGMINSNLFIEKSQYGKYNSKLIIKKGILYVCYGHFANKSINEIISNCTRPSVGIVCYLPGYLLYKYWRNKYGK